MTPEAFQSQIGASEEQMARLIRFVEILNRWQAKINLVGKDTLADLWRRHLLDSAQLIRYIPPSTRRVADLGSGEGFPGLILAALDAPDVHLVESDSRKAAFLREAARAIGVSVTVHNKRAEEISPLNADVVTSRALAPLKILVDIARKHQADSGICLFLKGRDTEEELTQAVKRWILEAERHPSLSDPLGIVLLLREIRPCPR